MKQPKYRLALYIVYSLIVIPALISLLPSCQKRPAPPQVRIGYQPIAANAPLYVGLRNGFYARDGLDCKTIPFSSSVDAMYALQRGDVDVLFAPPLNNIADALSKAPGSLIVIAIHGNDETHYFEGFLVPSDSQLKTLSQFRRGRVGCYPGSFAEKIAKAILSRYTSTETLAFMKLDFAAQLGALEGKTIDMLFAYEPLITIATNKGVARILEVNPISKYFFSPFPVSGVCISSQFAHDHPETAELFVKSNNRVMAEISKNRAIMAEGVSAYGKIDPSLAKQISQCYFSPVTEEQKQATARVLNLYKKLGIIETVPNIQELFYETVRSKRR